MKSDQSQELALAARQEDKEEIHMGQSVVHSNLEQLEWGGALSIIIRHMTLRCLCSLLLKDGVPSSDVTNHTIW